MPRPVSIASCFFGFRPRSKRYLATQRTPLPHISPSDPSALNIRIRTSARSEGMIRIRPSPPTPKWRSDTARASGRRVAWGVLVERVDVHVIVADSVHLGEAHAYVQLLSVEGTSGGQR